MIEGEIRSYRDLKVWQDAMDLVEACYRVTQSFPRDELFGITSQIRRAAVSIPANIAEGYGRDQMGSYVQFLKIAQGSLKELETHLLIAGRLALLEKDVLSSSLDRCEVIGKMLRSLIRSLQKTATE